MMATGVDGPRPDLYTLIRASPPHCGGYARPLVAAARLFRVSR